MKLNLGCGYNKFNGYLGLDVDKKVKPDIVCDLNAGIPFKDNSIDKILCYHLLEHLPDYHKLINEIHRVLKDGADVLFKVPEFGCTASIGDPMHVRYFVMDTFMHYGNPKWFQPSNFYGHGMFELIEGVIVKWKDKDEADAKAGKYFTEIIVQMRKVGPGYWDDKDDKPFVYDILIGDKELR